MESVAVNFMFQKDLYLERVLMGYNDDDDAGF